MRILLWELTVQSSGMFYQCCPNQALSFIIFLISKLNFFMGGMGGEECKVCMNDRPWQVLPVGNNSRNCICSCCFIDVLDDEQL